MILKSGEYVISLSITCQQQQQQQQQQQHTLSVKTSVMTTLGKPRNGVLRKELSQT